MNRALLLATLSATVLLTGIAAAEPAMFVAGPEGRARFFDGLLDDVGASDAQRAQIGQIRANYEAQIKALHDVLRNNHETLQSLDSQAGDFLARAGQIADENAQVRAQLDRLMAELRQQNDAVLTADQRAQLQQLAAARRPMPMLAP